MRNERRHVEYVCRCSACLRDFRVSRRFHKNFIFSSIVLGQILTNLDLSVTGAYYSPSISNTKSKHICRRR
jgi:hypothetical protein